MRARANDSMRHDGFEGVLVERQVPPGVEIIVGLQNDPHFGPVLMVGTGGIYTDLLADVAFRMLPVNRAQVKDMLAGLEGRALLEGFRGSQPCDVKALEDCILNIAKLGADIAPYLESADFNPVIVTASGAVVVDAKVVLSDAVHPGAIKSGRPRTEHLE